MKQSILHRLLAFMLSVVLVLGLMLIWIPQDSFAEDFAEKETQTTAPEKDGDEEIVIDDNDTPREIPAKVYRFSNRFLGLRNHDITVTIYGTFPVGTKVEVTPEDVDGCAGLQNSQGLRFAFEDGEGKAFIPEQSIEISICFDNGKLDNIEDTAVWSVSKESEITELEPTFEQDTIIVDANNLCILAYGTNEEDDTEKKISEKESVESTLQDQSTSTPEEKLSDEKEPEVSETAVEELGKPKERESTPVVAEKEQQLVPQVIKAQTYKEKDLTVQDGTVLIALSGMLPEEATVTAIPVNVAIEGQLVLAAYDITIYDKNGEEFEPDNSAIAVSINTRDIQTAIAEDKPISIFHLEKETSEPEEIGSVRIKTKTVQFDADAFSIYVVSTPHNTETYEFYVDGELYYKEILSNGETLIEPPTPNSSDGGTFQYWALEGNRFTGFVPVEVTETKAYRLDAVFDNSIHVTYFDNSDPEKVIKTEVYQPGEEVDLEGTTIPLNSTQKLMGWSTTKNATEVLDGLVAGNQDVSLYPVIKTGCWIEFDTDGGSYIEPSFVENGTNVSRPLDPVRAGYTFVKWVDEHGNDYNFSSAVTENTTLKAIWRAEQTSYTIVYWGEVLGDDSEYEVLKTETGTAVSGTVLTASDFSSRAYDYYHFVRMDPSSEVVNGDGSTVVNLYFDRNIYNLVFNIGYESSLGEQALSNLKMVMNGETYNYYGSWSGPIWNRVYTEPIKYAFSAKYGENIQNSWPTAENFTGFLTHHPTSDASKYFFGWINADGADTLIPNKKYYLTEDIIDSANKNINNATVELTGQWEGVLSNDSRSLTVYYYVQKDDGNITPYNESNYYLVNPGEGEMVNVPVSVVLSSWRDLTVDVCSPVEGYHQVYFYDHTDSTWTGRITDYRIYVYFAKNAYSLTVNNGGTKIFEGSKYYRDNISEYLNEPSKPVGKEEYSFSGWYTNPAFEGEPFTDSLMPSENLILYAKWDSPSYIVAFDSKGGEPVGEQLVEKGNHAEEPTEPIREGYVFGGWIDSANGDPFSFSTKIEHAYNLEALWISDTSYTVSYDLGSGSGTAPSDSNQYIEGAGVTVKDPGIVIPPEDSNGFLGWKMTIPDGNERIYYPGDVLEMPANDITLTAVYAGKRTTIIKYDPNGGIGDTAEIAINDYFDEEPKIPNSDYTVLSPETLNFSRAGFKFIGWSRTANDKTNLLQPDDIIHVDTLNKDNNVLYAQWEAANTLKVTKQVNGDYGDNTKEFEIRITLRDSAGQPLTGSREFSASGKYSSLTFEDGIATVLLKHGESVEIADLEDWSVSVEETCNGSHIVSYIDENDQSLSFPLLLSENTIVNVINTRDDIPATGTKTGDTLPTVLIFLVILSMVGAARIYKKNKT